MVKQDELPVQIPGFLLNTVPKSGTHLMKQILLGIPNVTHDPTQGFYEGTRYEDEENYLRLSQMPSNSFAAGHVFYSKEWSDMLRQLGIKHIFMIRDLRDIVISYVNFIVEKYPDHHLHAYMTQKLTTPKQRYMTFIQGIHELNHPNIKDWFNLFQGWVHEPNVHLVTFESLMQSSESRTLTITRLANFLWADCKLPLPIPQMVARMEQNVNPTTSVTFRKGKIGSWREEFDPEVKQLFKEITGDLLIQTNYEQNNQW